MATAHSQNHPVSGQEAAITIERQTCVGVSHTIGAFGARGVMLAGFWLMAAGFPASADPVFDESSASANIDFVHGAELEVEHNRAHGVGAATADYDNDGWVDLYIANGWGLANQLYHNDGEVDGEGIGDGTFTEVAELAGAGEADLVMTNRESKGALFLDYDGDGLLDLLVLNDADAYDSAVEDPPETMQNQLFHNLGNGQFEDATDAAQIPARPYQNQWGGLYGQVIGAAAGDLNGDGYPEIYLSYWRDEDVLLLNSGDGPIDPDEWFAFTDITVASGIDTLDGDSPNDSQAPLMWDFNADGLLDIHVCVDFSIPDLLFINQGGLIPTFEDQAPAAGLDVAWNEMGVALGDYDNDGDLDLYMTNIEWPGDVVGTDEPAIRWNRFMRNDSTADEMIFVDIGGPNVEVVRTGWSCAPAGRGASRSSTTTTTAGSTWPWSTDKMAPRTACSSPIRHVCFAMTATDPAMVAVVGCSPTSLTPPDSTTPGSPRRSWRSTTIGTATRICW